VKILGYFEANDTAYFVMEYEEGIDLSQYLKQEKRALSQEEILSIMMPILEGLKEVHKYNYLHRDIKPGNILLRSNKSPVLIDFGASKLALGEASKSITSMLTEGYAPLEQYSTDIKRQGSFTDLYATAAVMYKMITGNVPPSAQTRSYQMLSDENDSLKLLSKMNLSGYEISFLSAIDRALSLKGKVRPQNVQEFQADLAGKLKIGNQNIPQKAGMKNNSRVIGSLVILLLFIGGIYYYLTTNSHENKIKNFNQNTRIQQGINGSVQSTIAKVEKKYEHVENVKVKKEAERLVKEREEIEQLRKEKFGAQKEELETLRKEKKEREEAKRKLEKLSAEKLAQEILAAEELALKEVERIRIDKEKASLEFPLTIHTVPSNAKVQILNIKPKYYDGIKLKQGIYNIRISKNGYKNKNFTIDPSISSIKNIVLQKSKVDKNIIKIGSQMWQDESIDIQKKFSWNRAIKYCRNLTLGGYNDWRLPSQRSVQKLYKYKYRLSKVTSGDYWSSSSSSYFPSYAWYVNFRRGDSYTYNKRDRHYLRCVRNQ